MTDIEHETDIEKLRARAIELYLENEALQQRLAELIERLSRATDPAEAAALRSEIAKLKAQREKQAKKLFGKGSERRTPPPGVKQDGPKKDQTGHGPTPQPDLDVVPQVHKLDDTTCPECGGQLVAIPGEFETHDEIDVEPRKPIIRRYKRQKYACQCRECVETAPGPTKLIPGGRYSVRFAALVAVDKYDAVVPLERQCSIRWISQPTPACRHASNSRHEQREVSPEGVALPAPGEERRRGGRGDRTRRRAGAARGGRGSPSSVWG